MITSQYDIHNELDSLFTMISSCKNMSIDDIINGKPKEVSVIAEYLDCNEEETVVFIVMLYESLTNDFHSLEEIRDRLQLKPIDVFKLERITKQLVSKGYVIVEGRSRRYKRTSVFIRQEIYNHIVNKESIAKPNVIFDSVLSMLDEVDQLISKKSEDEISLRDFLEKIRLLQDSNMEISIFKIASDLQLNDQETLVLLYVSKETAKGDELVDFSGMVSRLFTDFRQITSVKKSFTSSATKLISSGIMEFSDDKFKSFNYLKLTQAGNNAVFENEIKINEKFSPQHCLLIHADKISNQKLFFDGDLKHDLDSLNKYLGENKFQKIKNSLAEKGFGQGIVSLFHGVPGSGKTESILQLARSTGRHILKVEISQIRDKYVGDSEKKLKEVFINYEKALSHFDKAPILLFNEADALLGNRIQVRDSVDQMNNTMQNILLEELENFKGILFATTNLVNNLDAAFERRFLFKVRFNYPGAEIRSKIWSEKLKGYISRKQALEIADQFELSGGEINNIARKIVMEEALSQKTPGFERIIEFCEAEKWYKPEARRRLGFVSASQRIEAL